KSVKPIPQWTAEAAREHWAFQPVKAVTPPEVSDAAWPKQELDRFILGALDAQKLHPSPDTEPSVLLRRLHFDLVGLPPAPEALARFQQRINEAGLDAAL